MFPLILTLKLDSASFRYFDDLRQKYFPPERNFLAAHLTMFHHLPGDELEKIKGDVHRICRGFSEFPLNFTGWRSLGNGVAIRVEAIPLLSLRGSLVDIWQEHLKSQDRQKFQPHITVQNKVAPDEARALLAKLSGQTLPPDGTAKGVAIWHYLGAKWKLEDEFLFAESV
jgi:2'-5' RNA ligase